MATSAGAATFTNGSFELGVNPGSSFVTLGNGSTGVTGWVVGGDSIDYIGGYWQAEDGSRSIDLSGNANGSIAQTFDTVANQTYQVFEVHKRADGSKWVVMCVTPEDEALVNALVSPGHPSTAGYNDPVYPLVDRVTGQ